MNDERPVQLDTAGFTIDWYTDGLIEISYSSEDSDAPVIRLTPGAWGLTTTEPHAVRKAIKRAFAVLGEAVAEAITSDTTPME